MGTVTNISGEDLEVPCLRRVVKNGETVEAPDELLNPDVQVWPAATWQVNAAPAPVEVAPAAEVTV